MGQKHSHENYQTFDVNKNIYGQPLQSCQSDKNDLSGSWDTDGKCSELGGGVHQICVSNIPANFSETTSQSDWSHDRNSRPHCLCLGAYALYVAKGNSPDLDCDAIPENAFNPNYINKWSTWNGNELPDQIKAGVNQLYDTCKEKKSALSSERTYLRNLYKKMKQKM